jgi:hypothetical protein
VVVTLTAHPRVGFVLFEEAGLTPSREQLSFRQRWLASTRKD